jgi:hypothetical protein
MADLLSIFAALDPSTVQNAQVAVGSFQAGSRFRRQASTDKPLLVGLWVWPSASQGFPPVAGPVPSISWGTREHRSGDGFHGIDVPPQLAPQDIQIAPVQAPPPGHRDTTAAAERALS